MKLLKTPFEIPEVKGPIQPTGQRGDVDWSYYINYDWGTLQVSREAEASAGLIPLIPGVITDTSPPVISRSKLQFKTRVSILGKSEIEAPEDLGPIDDRFTPVALHKSYRGLLDLTIGVVNNSDVVNHSVDMFARVLDEDDNNEEDLLLGSNEQTAREMLTHELPQVMSHILSGKIGESLSAQLSVYQSNLDANIESLHQRKLTSLGYLAAAFSVDISYLLAHSPTYGLLGATIAGIATLRAKDNRFNKYLRSNEEKSEEDNIRAQIYGSLIASSIHQTFCAGYFEERMPGNNDAPEDL